MANAYAAPNPIFQPAMRIVTAITNQVNAQVTTSFAHNFITGEIVRITVEDANAMTEINNKFGAIVVLSATLFSIAIDTTGFTPFVVPSQNNAYCIPIAEVNSILYAATQNVLPTGAR